MKRITAILVVIIFAVTALPGIAITPLWGGEARLADGKTLYTFITKADQYREWELWPGQDRLALASGPHGFWITTYVNGTAYAALMGREDNLPQGSIIVNENYTFDGELKVIRVMYKETGYNPAAGDWFFAMFGPEGDIRNEGRVDLCIGCHRYAPETDYLLTDLPEGYDNLASATVAGRAGVR